MSKNLDEEIDESLLNQAEDIIGFSDKKIMALTLMSSDHWSQNYQMVMNIKLGSTMRLLNKDIIKLRKSMNISSWIMSVMTLLILILTGVLAWNGVSWR